MAVALPRSANRLEPWKVLWRGSTAEGSTKESSPASSAQSYHAGLHRSGHIVVARGAPPKWATQKQPSAADAQLRAVIWENGLAANPGRLLWVSPPPVARFGPYLSRDSLQKEVLAIQGHMEMALVVDNENGGVSRGSLEIRRWDLCPEV